jgi:Protein of unknown function (DUF1697)
MKMRTFIAFFRGINVGGNAILPMRDLVETLEGLGLKSVKTYIQSGNAVFQSTNSNVAELSRKITAAIETRHGLAPHVLLLGIQELQEAMAGTRFHKVSANRNRCICFSWILYPTFQIWVRLRASKPRASNSNLPIESFISVLPTASGVPNWPRKWKRRSAWRRPLETGGRSVRSRQSRRRQRLDQALLRGQHTQHG